MSYPKRAVPKLHTEYKDYKVNKEKILNLYDQSNCFCSSNITG